MRFILREATDLDKNSIFDFIQLRPIGMGGSLKKHDYGLFVDDFKRNKFFVLEDDNSELIAVTRIINKQPKICWYVNKKDKQLEKIKFDATELCGTLLKYNYTGIGLTKYIVFGSVFLYNDFLSDSIAEVIGDIDVGYCTFYNVYLGSILKYDYYEAELINDIEKFVPNIIKFNDTYSDLIGSTKSNMYHVCRKYMNPSDYICLLDGGPILTRRTSDLIKDVKRDLGRYFDSKRKLFIINIGD